MECTVLVVATLGSSDRSWQIKTAVEPPRAERAVRPSAVDKDPIWSSFWERRGPLAVGRAETNAPGYPWLSLSQW